MRLWLGGIVSGVSNHFFRLIGERVNKNNLTKGLFTTLLLVSSVVNADEKYPAADFQPSVVYQDDAYIKNNASTQTAVKNAAPVATTAAPVAKHEADSKYPAADFQPTVVFSDANYKHDKSIPASKNVAKTSSASADEVQAEVSAPADKKKEDSTSTYLIGLIGLAAAGFFLFRKQSATPATAKKVTPASSTSTGRTAANTGVAKYLNKVSGTGVSRYVENQIKTAKSATGVAKYVAQKTLADKARVAEEAEKKTTSVERYMRNRG